MKKAGEILKEFREREKLTGEKFGQIIGCTQQQVSRMEKGTRDITEQTLEILKNYMEEREYKKLKESIDYYKCPESIREKLKELEAEKNTKNIIPYFPSIQASAGYGILNSETRRTYYEVPYKYSKKGNIAIRIKGDSMFPVFEDKDIVIINTNKTELEKGKIFVVNYQDELFIKRINWDEEHFYLESFNKEYPMKKIDFENEFKVIGKVIYSCREY